MLWNMWPSRSKGQLQRKTVPKSTPTHGSWSHCSRPKLRALPWKISGRPCIIFEMVPSLWDAEVRVWWKKTTRFVWTVLLFPYIFTVRRLVRSQGEHGCFAVWGSPPKMEGWGFLKYIIYLTRYHPDFHINWVCINIIEDYRVVPLANESLCLDVPGS